MRFRLHNVEVKISFLFCILICLILLFGSGNFIWAFVSVCAHELAHLFAMFLCGASVQSVSFEPFGIIIVRKEDMLSATKNLCIIVAGPAMNALLCGSAVLSQNLVKNSALSQFAAINFLLFLFHLFPVKGLDGGEAILLILRQFLSEKNAVTTANIASFTLAVILFAIGMILSFKVRYNLSLCAFSLYLLWNTFDKRR